MKNLPTKELKNVFKPLYKAGFTPATPFFKQADTKKIVHYLNLKKSLPSYQTILAYRGNNQAMELEDPLINDDIFASLLNAKREIIVGEKLYKYTYSGLFIANVEDSLALKSYIKQNNINTTIPDPKTLPQGLTSVTPKISRFVAPEPSTSCFEDLDPNSPETEPHTPILLKEMLCSTSGHDGSTPPDYNHYPTTSPYTESLKKYIKNLEPCNVDDAGVIGDWTPFGNRKVCYDYFSSGVRRTKTLFMNQDYWLVENIGVKVKHQRKHSVLFSPSWWAAKEANEVGVIIREASFLVEPQNMLAPLPKEINLNIPSKNMIFYVDGYAVEIPDGDFPYYDAKSWLVPKNLLPSTPFDEDVIVLFFNNNISFSGKFDITAKQVKELFWNNIYDLAVNAGKSVRTDHNISNPIDKITTIVINDKKALIQYTDLSTRIKNTKKIKKILASEWSNVTFSFNLSFNSIGNILTSPDILSAGKKIAKSISDIEFQKIIDYKNIKMDIIGVSRVGNEWRGSHLIYKE